MPAVMTPNQVVREDLSNALILADVRNTPVTSRMRKGEKLENQLYSWPLELMGGRQTTPPPENADVSDFEGDQEFRLYNRSQRFWRKPRVSVQAEKVNNAAGNFGKYRQQVTKKTKEQKRDVESVILSTQDSNDDTGIVGCRTLGMGRVINDGTLAFGDNQTVIPSQFRTPAAQIYTGTLANLAEDNFVAILQARYDNLGQTTELVLFSDSSLKTQISRFFGKYTPNRANFTTVVRTETQAIDSRKFAAYGIDVYEGDFGTFEIVLVPFMPKPPDVTAVGMGYGVNMDYVNMRPLMYCDHTELPYLGGGRSGLIDSILGWEFGDPRGHFKIQPSG